MSGATSSSSWASPSPLDRVSNELALPVAAPAHGEAAFAPLLSGRAAAGRAYLWSPDEVQRLRTRGRLAITPIGSCSAKAATNGKAAAVPALLSDEELFLCNANGWLPPGALRGEGGEAVDAADLLSAALRRELALTPTLVPHLALRRLVFLDLWRKGYACTNGLKFGVHFLAYRGDPAAVHAAFMVIVAREGEGIALLDLVARSRVATTALKICVMAWADAIIEGGDGGADAGASADAADGLRVRGLVRYAAFKRMGPGTALFADSVAQQAGRARHAEGEELHEHQQGPQWVQMVPHEQVKPTNELGSLLVGEAAHA